MGCLLIFSYKYFHKPFQLPLNLPSSSTLVPLHLSTSHNHHIHHFQYLSNSKKMANPTPKPSPSLILFVILCCCLCSSLVMGATFNVVSFGAKSDGRTDSTKAFLNAWAKACASTNPSSVYVPQGRFLLRSATFGGQCHNKAITFTIDGTLVAPSDYRVTENADKWLQFEGVNGVSIRGGVLDGQGTALWSCKNSGKGNCPTGATVRFTFMH